MKVVVFDVKGQVGHFRRPDTTATHLTYPFIPPTAAKGLVGAILGIEDFVTKDMVGIQLLSEVNMVSQQMSMLKMGNTFNRPTTVQLLINPAYRIYYAGEEYTDELEKRLKNKQSVYHTYLGSAYGLTTPIYRETMNLENWNSAHEFQTAKTVMPVSAIDEIKKGYIISEQADLCLSIMVNGHLENPLILFMNKREKALYASRKQIKKIIQCSIWTVKSYVSYNSVFKMYR